MDHQIKQLSINEFSRCSNIWDMEKQSELADQFYKELQSRNRITFIYTIGGVFVGEISLVFDMQDEDYTIPRKRVYLSRLIVKKDYRRQGIGKTLVDFAVEKAKDLGYSEFSIGVDLDNYPALKLYIEAGFDKVIFIGKDSQGQYLKLLKE